MATAAASVCVCGSKGIVCARKEEQPAEVRPKLCHRLSRRLRCSRLALLSDSSTRRQADVAAAAAGILYLARFSRDTLRSVCECVRVRL